MSILRKSLLLLTVLGMAPAFAQSGGSPTPFILGPRVHNFLSQQANPRPIVYSADGGQPTTTTCSSGSCLLAYNGGHVIENVKLYAVIWGSSVPSSVTSQISGFLQTFTNSAYFDGLNEYNTNRTANDGELAGQPGTNELIGRGVFARQITITPANTATTIADTDLATELNHQIDLGVLPEPDGDTMYVTYFPPGITLSNSNGAALSCQVFCAFHGTFSRSGQVAYYGAMPDLTQGACAQACGGNGTPFDNLTAVTAHEVTEAVTDPEVGFSNLSWYNSAGGEIGDICAYHEGTIYSADGGQAYFVQQEWSNTDLMCDTTRTSPTDFNVYLPTNSISLVAGSAEKKSLAVNTSAVGGTSQLTLEAGAFPAGVTGSLAQGSVSAGMNTTLMLTAASATKAVTDAVAIVEADGPNFSHTAGVLVNVTVPANDFSLSASATSVAVAPGGSGKLTLATTSTRGTAETVTFSVSGLPTGVTGTFNPASVTAGASTTLTLTAASGVTPSAAQAVVTATAASTVKAATVNVAVAGAPSVSFVSPTSGSSVPNTVAPVVVSASVDANVQLTSITISDGSATVGSCTKSPCTVTWTPKTTGAHTLKAMVMDSAGGMASTSETVQVTKASSGCAAGGPLGSAAWLALLGLVPLAARRRHAAAMRR